MENISIIFKITKHGEAIAFLPEKRASNGMIVFFQSQEQCNQASMAYYAECRLPHKTSERKDMADLREEYIAMYGKNKNLNIVMRDTQAFKKLRWRKV